MGLTRGYLAPTRGYRTYTSCELAVFHVIRLHRRVTCDEADVFIQRLRDLARHWVALVDQLQAIARRQDLDLGIVRFCARCHQVVRLLQRGLPVLRAVGANVDKDLLGWLVLRRGWNSGCSALGEQTCGNEKHGTKSEHPVTTCHVVSFQLQSRLLSLAAALLSRVARSQGYGYC